MFTGHLLCTGHFPCIVYSNPPNSNTGSGVVILTSQLRKRTLREVKDPFQWYTSGEAKVELICLWFQCLCVKLDTFFLPTGSSQFLKCEGENQGTPTRLFACGYISQEPTNSVALMLNLHLPPAASPIEAGPMQERVLKVGFQLQPETGIWHVKGVPFILHHILCSHDCTLKRMSGWWN